MRAVARQPGRPRFEACERGQIADGPVLLGTNEEIGSLFKRLLRAAIPFSAPEVTTEHAALLQAAPLAAE